MDMKDCDLRGIVLKQFYEHRHDESRMWSPFDYALGQERARIIANICLQLTQNGLLDYREFEINGMGAGRITARGVDVIEGTATPPITINIDKSINVTGTSNQIAVGDNTSTTYSMSGGAINTASDAGTASFMEKPKSLWDRVLGSSLVKKIIGWFAPSPTPSG